MKPISKKKFVEIINTIKDVIERYQALYKIGVNITFPMLEDTVIDLLNHIFDDNSNWIEYFIFDLDFGTKWTEKSITTMEDEPIYIRTPEELYDYLVENMEVEK